MSVNGASKSCATPTKAAILQTVPGGGGSAKGRGESGAYIHKLHSRHRLGCRRISMLHPIDHAQQDVVLRIQNRPRRPSRRLPNLPCADPAFAVRHAANAEEAIEGVELARRQAHGDGHMIVIARRVLRRDNGVGGAMVMQDFAAAILEGTEIAFPGRDAGGVFDGGDGGIIGVESVRVPRWVFEDGIAHPVNGVLGHSGLAVCQTLYGIEES